MLMNSDKDHSDDSSIDGLCLCSDDNTNHSEKFEL